MTLDEQLDRAAETIDALFMLYHRTDELTAETIDGVDTPTSTFFSLANLEYLIAIVKSLLKDYAKILDQADETGFYPKFKLASTRSAIEHTLDAAKLELCSLRAKRQQALEGALL